MKPHYRKRPWSTLLKTVGLSVILAFPVAIIADSEISPGNFYLITLVLGLGCALYSDYLWPYWRNRTRTRILDVVSSDKNTSPTPTTKERESPPAEVPSLSNIPERLSAIKPLDISFFKSCLTGDKHRFDRLRQYRHQCRYLTSAMLIILILVFVVIEDFDTYLPISIAEGGWQVPPYLFGVFFSLCVLLEYNISLIVGKPVSGVFFRDHSQPVASPSEGLDGEEKVGFLMWRNPLGIGTGIAGRPVLGIVCCLGWLLAIFNWAITACCILVTALLMKRFRNALELPDGPFAILELRVFDTPAYSGEDEHLFWTNVNT